MEAITMRTIDGASSQVHFSILVRPRGWIHVGCGFPTITHPASSLFERRTPTTTAKDRRSSTTVVDRSDGYHPTKRMWMRHPCEGERDGHGSHVERGGRSGSVHRAKAQPSTVYGRAMGRQNRKGRRQAIEASVEAQTMHGVETNRMEMPRNERNGMQKEREPTGIQAHPTQSVAVVVRNKAAYLVDVKVCETIRIVRTDASEPREQGIRSVRFHPTGTRIVTAGDDKHLRLWDEQLKECLEDVAMNKKISATAFVAEENAVLVADKFGDVHVVESYGPHATSEPRPFLGHFGSAVLDIQLSPCGRHVVTCDADGKIRVSRMPKKLRLGCHVIESYCLGHRGSVFHAAFVHGVDSAHRLLSCGEDGTLRLWDVHKGKQLDAFDLNLGEDSSDNRNSDISPANGNGANDGDATAGCETRSEERQRELRHPSSSRYIFLVADQTGQIFAAGEAGSSVVHIFAVDARTQRIALQQRLLCPEGHLLLCGTFSADRELLLLTEAKQGPSAFLLQACRSPGAQSFAVSRVWSLDSDENIGSS